MWCQRSSKYHKVTTLSIHTYISIYVLSKAYKVSFENYFQNGCLVGCTLVWTRCTASSTIAVPTSSQRTPGAVHFCTARIRLHRAIVTVANTADFALVRVQIISIGAVHIWTRIWCCWCTGRTSWGCRTGSGSEQDPEEDGQEDSDADEGADNGDDCTGVVGLVRRCCVTQWCMVLHWVSVRTYTACYRMTSCRGVPGENQYYNK